MAKLEKLTKAQEDKLSQIKEKWVHAALYEGDELEVESFKKGITFIYSLSKLTDPLKVFVDSPMGLQYACQILKNLDLNKIKWSRPNFRIKWLDQNTNKIRTYLPDFFLPDYNYYLDVKNPIKILEDSYKLQEVSKIIPLFIKACSHV